MLVQFKQILQRFGLEYWNKYYGVYRGSVYDNKDPDKLGRLKLIVPQVWEQDHHNYWCNAVGTPSGNNTGLLAVPDIGETVWVMFENGNPEFPVWLHGWFKPTEGITDDSSNYPETMVLSHRSGNKIVLNGEYLSLVRQKRISLGQLGGSAEPVVLGDKNEIVLNEILSELKMLKTQVQQLSTAFPPTPSGVSVIAQSQAALIQLTVDIAATEAKVKSTKSNNVTTD